ncbi:MAG: extracellular solute-binding protein [Deltaproteobacteria bacterium]|nr:extracellular solute-binding protein [Deltaproteobacteria bacterium]
MKKGRGWAAWPQLGTAFLLLLPFLSWPMPGSASIGEIVGKAGSLKGAEREAYLKEGAKKEGRVMLYGTLLPDAFPILQKAFQAEYPSVILNLYRGSRNEVLNRTLAEARAGRYAADVIQIELSYGLAIIRADLVAPYPFIDTTRFIAGTYDKKGYWHPIFIQTRALCYNTRWVSPDQAPKSYQDLLHPKWKGKMVLDPEAAYLLAAMEQSWGRDRAIAYLKELSRQNLHFVRSQGLTVQLVSAGEYELAVVVVGQSAAEQRDRGAPLGFSILSPKILSPHGLFLANRAPHPHAAILFVEWITSEKGQKILAGMGRSPAMKGVPVRHKEFQIEGDYVVSPEFASALERYLNDFREIFGLTRSPAGGR